VSLARNFPDPIRLSLFASRAAALCEEMGAALHRTALSVNIRDRRDYSCALFDPTGEMIAQATHIPVHLGSMAYAMRSLAAGRTWHSGDVLILNDPFQGGTHLPDVTMIEPLVADGEVRCFVACRAHFADIGAGETGSMGVATRLADEGVLIPPSLLVAAGRPNPDVLAPLYARVRDRRLVAGDIAAQSGACEVGIRRAAEWIATTGAEAFAAQVVALQDYSATLTSRALAALPAGTYRARDWLDGGQEGVDIPVEVTVTLDGGMLTADFGAGPPMVSGNLNCPLSVTAAAVVYVVRCLLPAEAPSAGILSAVRIKTAPGTLLDAMPPAAVAAGNVETSTRLVDVLFRALAQAAPERIAAASQGTMNNLAMAGAGWSYYETIAGGAGGGPRRPGADAIHTHLTNTLNTPVEILETHYPLRLRRYQVRRGSGGAGARPGGSGVIREYEFLAPARVALIAERRRRGPWGLAGGHDGAPGRDLLDGTEIPGSGEFDVRPGQVLTVMTPGGGGHGAP